MRLRVASGRRKIRGAGGARWLGLALLALVVAFAVQTLAAPRASAHALPVRSEPAADAILSAPPSQVRMWFSEALNPAVSRIVVVDPSNHEVDTRDSLVNDTDSTEMAVGLQLLRPGTYVVVWRTQSAVDGHVTGGSFIFRIANADGSVPPIPATLPSGNTPGAAGFGSSAQTIDVATMLQTLAKWLALLFALFWVGGVFWEVWVLPEGRAPRAVVALGARLAAVRFQRLASYALFGALIAGLAEALALTEQVAGAWSGALDPRFWHATLFSGSFGVYWWLRQGTLLAALVLLAVGARGTSPEAASEASVDAPASDDLTADAQPISSWTRAALAVLRQTPRLPVRLGERWLDLHPLRQIEVGLAALLLFAFAMSGHAAATPPSERAYAVGVDLAHLLFSACWLGGLFYISVALIPAAQRLPERTQALLLAYGVPEFGVLAIVSAAALALTGSLNAGVRLTSLAQFATTAYGRTLFVKIEIFLFMVAISAFHAFWLRPRLAHALARPAQSREAVSVGVASEAPAVAEGSGADDAAPDTREADVHRLRTQMEDWLRREAMLGVGVLLCVALLSLFAGSLTPAQATPTVGSTSAFRQTQTAGGYAITLAIAPARFGSNTFTVTLDDAQGKPVQGAAVLTLMQSLDMDMGQQTMQVQPVGASQPGVYQGTGDLTMAGHWGVHIKALPPGAKTFVETTFTLTVGS